jgi:ClpP class serine protease
MKTQCKLNWEAPASALARFNPEVRARKKDEKEISIDMYSTIGEYGDGMGVTAKLVSSILRKADGADVVVNINSPGGD